MNTLDVLRGARDLIANHGWAREAFCVLEDGRYSFCALGATVDDVHPSLIYLAFDGANTRTAINKKHIQEIRHLPPPEPEWKPGDVVLDFNGRTRMRTEQVGPSLEFVWVSPTGMRRLRDSEVPRPLTPLVVDGKAVS